MSKNKKIIIANWKMNLDLKSALTLSRSLSRSLAKIKTQHQVVVLPDFLALPEVIKNLDSRIYYGAQDVAPFPLGAYTGEVPLESLKQVKAQFVLIGHSERRQYFSDDSLVADKLKNVLENSNIVPILAIGETWEQRKKGETIKIIKQQLQTAFSKLDKIDSARIIIAYEPVWAIGSGLTVKPLEAVEAFQAIKKVLQAKSWRFKIVYGGSVNLNNYLDFKNLTDLDGFLIGGARLKPLDFVNIIKNF